MFAADLTLVGQGVHLFVVVIVVGIFVGVSARSIAISGASSEARRDRTATILSLVALCGGAFRLIALDTTGRRISSGACLVVALVLAMIALRTHRVRWSVLHSSGPAKWMVFYAAAALPSILIATDSWAAAGGAGGVVALVLVALAFGANFDEREILKLLERLAVAVVVLAASNVLFTPGASGQTIRSPLVSYRFVGWFPFIELGWGHLGVGLVIVGLVSRSRAVYAVPAGLMLIGVTQARGAVLSLVLVVLIWFALDKRRWLPAALVGFGAVLIMALTVQPVRDLWDREQAIAESDSLLTYRADFVQAALEVARQSPIIGRGIDSGTVDDFSAELTIGRSDLVTSTHMAWTSALAGTGVLGLLCLLGAVLSGWRWALRRRRGQSSEPMGRTLPVLVMTWVTASSFFVVGPAELSAQAMVFALAVVSPAVAHQRTGGFVDR